MARRKDLIIAGHKIPPGEVRDLQLPFSESYLGTPVGVPVRVIRAPADGPRLFITGAIHGDELSGVGIIRDLLYDKPPELLRGTIVCVPVVNVYGLEHHSRYLPDRRDLNRCFPGSPDGSVTSRLAHAVFEQIVRPCDYGIDFHNAAIRRTNYPNVRADLRVAEVKRLARAFGSEIIVDAKGPDGSLRKTAVAAGVATIIPEAGEIWKNEPGVVEVGVRGILNVLKNLEMIEGKPEPPVFQITVGETTWVRAERGGFLSFHARPGEIVAAGQALATNNSIFGRERQTLVSPVHGIVLGMTTMPAVKPGEPVYHIAILTERRYEEVKRRFEASPVDALYRRVQRDLATNIVLQERASNGACEGAA